MKHHYFIIFLFILYISLMTALMVWQGIGIAPDRYALVLLLGSLLIKRTRAFLLDWIPFLFILISYDFLRGLAPLLNPRVHYEELIKADLWLFGNLPTVTFQQLFYLGTVSWFDFLMTIFYFLHFALPLAFGFLVWVYSRNNFRQFILALLLLSYAGFFTFVLFPAAPPWLAKQDGYIHSNLTKIIDHTLLFFPEKLSLPTLYHNINPNPVAAIPSLHAGYPVLIFLFALSFFGLRGLLFLPYLIGTLFSVVYLGEHYVVDVIAGAIYALAFFVLAKYISHNVKFQAWLRKVIGQILGWSVKFANLETISPAKILSTLKKKYL